MTAKKNIMSEETVAVAEEVPAFTGESTDPGVISEITKMLEPSEPEPEAKGPEVKAEPEAKAEPEPEVQVEPEKKSRSADDFKLLKTQRDTAKSEVDTLKAEILDLKSKVDSGDIDSLRQERDDLSKRLRAASVERHPEFEKYYTNKLNGIYSRAKSTAGGEEGERMVQILKMDNSSYRDSQMEDLFSELTTSKQAQLGALIAQADEVRGERTAQLENADSAYETLQQQQNAKHEQMMNESRQTFNEVAERAGVLEVYQKREGDDAWNAEVDARMDLARNGFLGQSDENQLAMLALWGAAGEKYRELLATQIELNRRLQAQVDGVQGSNPSVAGSDGKAPAADVGFVDQVKAMMEG